MRWLLAGVAVVVVGGAAAAALWLRRRFVLVTVRGSSMEPTFRTGDRVLVRRTPLAAIRHGEVVVVEQPVIGLESQKPIIPQDAAADVRERQWMIKRAAGVPGTPVPEELAVVLGAAPGDLVPTGHLAVLGDNPNGSFDSRVYGYLTEAFLLGVAVRSMTHGGKRPPPSGRQFPDDHRACANENR